MEIIEIQKYIKDQSRCHRLFNPIKVVQATVNLTVGKKFLAEKKQINEKNK